MGQISPEQLRSWLEDATRAQPVLLDVREPWEHRICHIPNSLLMPMRTIPARQTELDPEADTVLICHHGSRSMQVGIFLERSGFKRLYNLSGGVDAWARRVEPTEATY
ncbi:MAG: sulfurtransferase [Betaproteobacteria bacterium]|nr:sulfurtransferase [Betaproteobacteria bacterium]